MTTLTIDRHQSIADIVLEHSECAQVFQRHRIDFCCGGESTVEDAAKAKQISVDVLIDDLSRAIAERSGDRQEDPRALSTSRLVAHIISKHHEYLRTTLPFVQTLAAKVRGVHGEHNPKLVDLEAAVGDLAAALLPHLDEEEELLFPELTSKTPDTATVDKQLAMMIDEHLAVARLLERVRAASDDFLLPEWACNSYQALFSELQRLESDVFTHVHLENHVLKPRFAAA